MATTTDPAQLMKQQVAKAAVDLVQSGMVVGLGSGSTAALAIQYLGEKLQSGEIKNIRGVPTSFQATVLARDYQIPLVTLDEIETLDVAIDGADEVDPHHNLIKGGGAAHMREKIVDSLAKEFIVVVDSSKLSSQLGTLFKVPVEVLPMALTPVTRAIKALGGEPELRMGVKKAGPVVTDQGNLVLDVKFANITDAVALEMRLNNIPGVLENGIFAGSVVSKVLVGEVKDGEPSVRELPKS